MLIEVTKMTQLLRLEIHCGVEGCQRNQFFLVIQNTLLGLFKSKLFYNDICDFLTNHRVNLIRQPCLFLNKNFVNSVLISFKIHKISTEKYVNVYLV